MASSFLTMLAARPVEDSADASVSWLDYASVAIAALAFLVALVLGLRNRGTARRALALSERQEARRDSRVDVYLITSISQRRPSVGHRLLGFHILVSNPTDRASSLVGAELHVTYNVNGVVTTVKVRHALGVTELAASPDVTAIELPIRLDANDAVTGWLLFMVDDRLTGGWPIDRYDVVVRDVHGIEETVQVTVLGEDSREQAT